MAPITGPDLGISANQIGKQIEQAGQLKKDGPAESGKFDQLINKNAPAQDVSKATDVASAQAMQAVQKVEKLPPKPTPKVKGLRGLLNNFSRESSTMNDILKMAMGGKKFSPTQLLLLQSATYKVSFDLQALSKTVEAASGAIKTTMQTQV